VKTLYEISSQFKVSKTNVLLQALYKLSNFKLKVIYNYLFMFHRKRQSLLQKLLRSKILFRGSDERNGWGSSFSWSSLYERGTDSSLSWAEDVSSRLPTERIE
jgi:hypothetical protein